MALLMMVQQFQICKCFPTLITDVLSLCMQTFVFLQNRDVYEGRPAEVTGEGPVSAVDGLVDLQDALAKVLFPTLITREHFGLRVKVLMNFQATSSAERFPTLLTLVSFVLIK